MAQGYPTLPRVGAKQPLTFLVRGRRNKSLNPLPSWCYDAYQMLANYMPSSDGYHDRSCRQDGRDDVQFVSAAVASEDQFSQIPPCFMIMVPCTCVLQSVTSDDILEGLEFDISSRRVLFRCTLAMFI
jgi:hypothetical protein